MENENCRSAKRFLREAGVLMIGGQGSALSNPYLLANHAWLRLSEKEQEALLEMLESVLALPYSGKPIEYLLSSGALEGIRVVLNEEESKLLTFIYDQPLRAYERSILQTYLDAHVVSLTCTKKSPKSDSGISEPDFFLLVYKRLTFGEEMIIVVRR